MTLSPLLVVVSPDGTKSVSLEYDGEARFGPAFYVGSAAGFSWPLGRAFLAEDVLWSPDSRYVVISIFLSRDDSRPPAMSLVAIETRMGNTIEIDRNAAGLIQAVCFSPDGALKYEYDVRAVSQERYWKIP